MYFLYLLSVFLGWELIEKKFTQESRTIIEVIWILLFLLCGTFAFFTDDFEAYREIIHNLYTDPLGSFHLEPTWKALGKFVNGNLIEFRFFAVVFGLLLNLIIVRLLEIKFNYYIGFFSLLCLNAFFCWLRQPIAIYLFIIGFYFLLKRRIILSILFFGLTIISHKTGIIFILLLPLTLLKTNKRNLIFIAATTVILIPFIMRLLLMMESQVSVFFLLYSEGEPPNFGRNILYILASKISLIIDILLLITIMWKLRNTIHGYDVYLLRLLVALLGISLALFFAPIETTTMIVRLIALGNVLGVILLSKYVKNRILKYSNCLIFILMFIFFTIGQLQIMVTHRYVLFNLWE